MEGDRCVPVRDEEVAWLVPIERGVIQFEPALLPVEVDQRVDHARGIPERHGSQRLTIIDNGKRVGLDIFCRSGSCSCVKNHLRRLRIHRLILEPSDGTMGAEAIEHGIGYEIPP